MSTAGNRPARAARLDTSAAASVNVRVSADVSGIARFFDALAAAAEAGGFEVAEPPQGFRVYPNHREPGFRMYLTVRFLHEHTGPARAGRRTAAMQSATPLPLPRAKETKEERRLRS